MKLSSKPTLLEGEIFMDERGVISSLNNFEFEGVKRFYFINNRDTSVVRGWHGHQIERKWFYCVQGGFEIALVQPDNWDNPSSDLIPEIFELDSEKSQILIVPGGYANCIRATQNNSKLMVLSGFKFEDCHQDSWRYDNTLWVDWISK